MQPLETIARRFFQYPHKMRVGIYVGGFLLLLASGGFLIIDWELQQLSELLSEIQQMQLVIQQAQNKIALLPALKQQQKKSLDELAQILPSATSTSTSVINSAAQTTALTIQTLTPAADNSTEHYTQTSIKISAIGNYQQMFSFLQQLQRSKIFVVPSAITVTTVDKQLKITLEINHYYHFGDPSQLFSNVAIVLPPNLPTTSTPIKRSPFLPPVLHLWRTVTMVGYLTTPKKQWGLLQLADGSVVPVAAGDQFSDYHTIIKQVASNYVVLTQLLLTTVGVKPVTQTISLQETQNAP